ncbi:MAG: hypothetical protein ACKV22_41270 [Bryobacteraceae bacterium]
MCGWELEYEQVGYGAFGIDWEPIEHCGQTITEICTTGVLKKTWRPPKEKLFTDSISQGRQSRRMENDVGYRKFQDLIFQEIQEKESLAMQTAIEELVRLAESKGLSLDDLIHMTESGMSCKQLLESVGSKPSVS